MVFKRHKISVKKKEEERYYKLTEEEVRGIKYLLIHARCYGSDHMVLHAGYILDDIKCKHADDIDWKDEYEKFKDEAKLVDGAIEEVFEILDKSRQV